MWTTCCWIEAYEENEDGAIICDNCLHTTQLTDQEPTQEQLDAVADANQDGVTTDEERQSWLTRVLNFLSGN